ncbi:MAG: hypothetical protein GXP18_07190 [Gammaproteobacteria bacterium]|nr:hypothetical protein [Gammaproteobacteria bacterium]
MTKSAEAIYCNALVAWSICPAGNAWQVVDIIPDSLISGQLRGLQVSGDFHRMRGAGITKSIFYQYKFRHFLFRPNMYLV